MFWNEEDKIDINGKFSSDKIIFEELFTITEINSDEGEQNIYWSS